MIAPIDPHAHAPRIPASPRAVIFDLDGTLTVPLLDFDAIRAEIGLVEDRPILEQLAGADEGLRLRSEEILRRHERVAMERATLAEGCAELLARLRSRAIPHGILTRNTREAVELFMRRFDLAFHGVYTREDGPVKPSPSGVLALCRGFAIDPADTLVVGDYKFDILAGRAAGCRTALVIAEPPRELTAWGPPDRVIASLRELLPLWD
jgi:HAD superfamily hydrolase (TIGR01549 family)